MIRKNLKSFVCGFLVCLIFMGSIGVFADSVSKQISVLFKDIKITIDGKEIKMTNEPFIYNGSTYVPIRFVAENLGKSVTWNNKNNTVEINNNTITTQYNNNNNNSSSQNTLLSTSTELEGYLRNKYTSLSTTKGTTNFDIKVSTNTSILSSYDYLITVEYDEKFFQDLKISNTWTNEQREKVRQELKNHMETLAKDAISKMPTKKMYGSYYRSWYTYPNLHVDLQVRNYYSWTNYDVVPITVGDMYNSTKPSTFRWWDEYDSKL